MPDVPVKRCSTCQCEKPLEAFSKKKRFADGLNTQCRECVAQAFADWYARNGDKVSARKKHQRTLPEYAETRAKINIYQNNVYHTNPEYRAKKIAASKVCNQRKPDHGVGRLKAYIASQPADWEIAVHYRWRQAHPEKCSAASRRYLTRLLNAPSNDFTATQWRALQIAFDHRCAYCGKRAKGHLTKDHITPISKGGPHTLANIVPACRQCNAKKRDGAPLVPVQPFFLL